MDLMHLDNRLQRVLILGLVRHDDQIASTTMALAKSFSQNNEVLLVEHPYTLIDCMKSFWKKSTWKRIRATFGLSTPIIQGTNWQILIPPVTLPANWLKRGRLYKIFQKVNHRLIGRTINRCLTKLKWNEYVYINSYNYHYPHLQQYLKKRCLLRTYHCVDPIIKPYTRKHGLINEKLTVLQSDLVISTSLSLQQKWANMNNSYLVTNGVTHSLIDQFNAAKGDIDLTVRSLGTSVFGYFGAIERRIDYNLLGKVFSKNSHWKLVMAGVVESRYMDSALFQLPNVHLIGGYQYHELVKLINSVDVTIIPFIKDEASSGIFPLKVYEYLASGKPVVSTDFNEFLTCKHNDVMDFASNDQEFQNLLEQALRNPAVGEERRKLTAKRNTWEIKAKQFQEIINIEYERKNFKSCKEQH